MAFPGLDSESMLLARVCACVHVCVRFLFVGCFSTPTLERRMSVRRLGKS